MAFYHMSGLFTMIHEKRELQLLGAAALLVFGVIVAFSVWLVRRWRRRRQARLA